MNWQPIETAPKDGTEVIVGYERAGVRFVHLAAYATRQPWMQDSDWEEGREGWWYFRTSSCQEKISPTQWLAPEDKKK